MPASQTRDFTLAKYDELCRALLRNGYTPVTISEYIGYTFLERQGDEDIINQITHYQRQKCVILRHDVDRKITYALRMAEQEQDLGIRSTYYFRYPHTFKPKIIATIKEMGHEVGYHYETLSKARGNFEKAINLFELELNAFHNIPFTDGYTIKTICMHGSPLSRYDNRDLWKRYDFKDYGIEGEAYLSMTGNGLHYLTDTGRTWGNNYSVRDKMPEAEIIPVETTDDLVRWIESAGPEDLYLTVHPERWTRNEVEWIGGSIKDLLMNTGKVGFLTFMTISNRFKRCSGD